MATTILATAGRAVAGPWGAALGALAGQAIDRAANARRADDLPVTSSAYGTAIPRVFGTARLAGNLVWSTPVRPSETGKGGAGRGAVASFALVLAKAPVARIGRIWADGTLLRDADGTTARRFSLREHLCGTAVADPLIAAAHPEGAPGYGGLCYVVWENLDLAPFGDRIPNLVFEVFGGSSAPGGWAATLFGCAAVPAQLHAEGMIAAARPCEDGAMAALLAGLRPGTNAGGVSLADEGAAHRVPRGDLTEEGRPQTTLQDGGPGAVEVAYIDRDRDFQRGVQRGGTGHHAKLIEIPAVLSAADAGTLAGHLAAEARQAETLSLVLPWRWLHVQPGDLLHLADGREWRVIERTVSGFCVELRCTSLARPSGTPAVDAGGVAAAMLQRVPPSRVAVFELPGRGVRAAVGGDAGWEGAALLAAFAPQGAVVDYGYHRAGQTFGTLAASLDDDASVVAVTVADPDALTWSGVEALHATHRHVVIGGEVIRYVAAQPGDEGLVMLSGVSRGAAGTRPMMADHAAGTSVVFLSAPGDWGIGLTAPAGTAVSVVATGPGDGLEGVMATLVVAGLKDAPPPPVQLVVQTSAEELRVTWSLDADVVTGSDGWVVRLIGAAGAAEQHSMALAAVFSRSQVVSIAGDRAIEVQVIALGSGPEWYRTASLAVPASMM